MKRHRWRTQTIRSAAAEWQTACRRRRLSSSTCLLPSMLWTPPHYFDVSDILSDYPVSTQLGQLVPGMPLPVSSRRPDAVVEHRLPVWSPTGTATLLLFTLNVIITISAYSL